MRKEIPLVVLTGRLFCTLRPSCQAGIVLPVDRHEAYGNYKRPDDTDDHGGAVPEVALFKVEACKKNPRRNSCHEKIQEASRSASLGAIG